MQKVLRRTVLAEAQAARRLARKKEGDARQEIKSRKREVGYRNKEQTTNIKRARQVRREDWELGPLAPKRDIGFKKETYGTVNQIQLRGEKLSLEERLRVNPEGGKYANIVVGDRAVLLEGRDKGKIGKVSNVDPHRQEVTVEGLNMVCSSHI